MREINDLSIDSCACSLTAPQSRAPTDISKWSRWSRYPLQRQLSARQSRPSISTTGWNGY